MYHAGAANSEHCCSSTTNPNAGSNIVNSLNTIIYDNPTAQQIKAVYGNPINNRTFYISGTFDVNQSITFIGCTFYFTPDAWVILNNSVVNLTFQNCTLQASCDLWGGIYANHQANRITGTNNSVFRDMITGIQVSNNALLSFNNCSFLHNTSQSIQIVNMSDPVYNGEIKNCTFTGPAWTAINVVNCKQLIVGDNATTNPSFNTISNMATGITIESSNTISTIIGSSTNNIEILNCAISNIKGDPVNNWLVGNMNTLPAHVYTTAAGTAIWVNYEQSPSFIATTKIKNSSNDFLLTPLINNCDKGIVNINSKLEASNLYLKDCQYSLMNSTLIEKDYALIHNKIENTHLGIQTLGIIGDANIQDNTITGCYAIQLQAGPNLVNAPIGIDVKHYLPSTKSQTIQGNFVSIDHFTGVGINTQTANTNQNIIGNTIKFNTNSTSNTFGQQTKDLVGIYLNNSGGAKLIDNYIDGINPNNSTLFMARQTKGIFFEESSGCQVHCNWIHYTKQGLYSYGQNNIPDMQYNKIKSTWNPMYTYDGATYGSFGNIGTSTYENWNNLDYDLSASILQDFKKVIRNTNDPNYPTITTKNTLIVDNESDVITTNGGHKYVIDNGINSTNPELCLVPPTGFFASPVILNGGSNVIEYNVEEALQIASETMEYAYYPDVAQWIDERQLFERLDNDELLRNSSATLYTFYNLKKQQKLGEIEDDDQRISMLMSEINATNTADVFDDMVTQNATEITDDTWIQNESAMNLFSIELMRNGIANLNTTNRTIINTLANTCPYIGGFSVFKARTLNAMYNPTAQYNDRILCLPQAQSKGITGNNQNIDVDSLNDALAAQHYGITNPTEYIKQQLLNPVKTNDISTELNKQTITVYPNPASSYLTLDNLNKANFFILYDGLGNIVLNTVLKEELNCQKIVIPSLANGIYTYKIVQQENAQVGKLKISQNE
ncbi:MAG: T9SS type A sorting domain-containing protein [Chitinophagaceae bacterium]|nr:T9SS type A sorting domain-containing protein [Chitinophagaceae bacterium]